MSYWNSALSGMILVGYWAIGLFFFHFWRKTADRFFLWFASAFWLLAVERIFLLAIGLDEETKALVYLIRLVAFLLILFAIFEKNRATRSNPPGGADS